jgi:hypothetical protein
MNFVTKNSVNPPARRSLGEAGCKSVSNNRIIAGFDTSSERTADIGFKPVRQGYLSGGLCLWMQKAINSPESKQNPRNPRLKTTKTTNFPQKICENH